MYDRILIPTDGSESVDDVVANARAVAERFDAEIHVLFVVDERLQSLVQEYRDWGETVGETVTEELEELGREAVDDVVERLSDEVPVTESIVVGVPHRAILDYADDTGIDLIVMGTHGRTGISRSLLGSVTERVVRSSEVPVLTVRTR